MARSRSRSRSRSKSKKKKHKSHKKPSRSRSRSRGGGRDRRRSRSRSRDRRRRSPPPKLDEFGRVVEKTTRSRSASMRRRRKLDKERQLQKEVDEKRKKEEARVKEREERLAQIKQEPDAEIRLRELTKHAAWNHEGPRPPGSDLSLYRHEKHMGYVAKDKSGWVYSPAEKTWYQKLTGLYFVYCDKTHAYVPAEG